LSFLDDELLQGSSERRFSTSCNDAYADKGRTSGSEVSLEESEFEFSSPFSSESDEMDGARKVPLLRGELKRDSWMRLQENPNKGNRSCTVLSALEMGTKNVVR
jgi:hypothetical protein